MIEKLNKQPLYVKLYISTIILLGLLALVSGFFKNVNFFSKIIVYLFLINIFLAASLHTFYTIKLLWNNKILKLLFSALLGYIVIFTDSKIRINIYNIVKENPDNFTPAIHALDLIYVYIYFILSVISILFILSIVAPLVDMVFESFSKKIGVTAKIFPMLIIAIFFILFFVYNAKNINTFDKKIKEKTLLFTSYYPNRTCNNRDAYRHYIRLVGVSGKISISNVTVDEFLVSGPVDSLFSIIKLDKDIEFYSDYCDKIDANVSLNSL